MLCCRPNRLNRLSHTHNPQGRRLVLWVLGLSYAGRKLQYQLRQRSVDDCHKRLLTILRLWVIMDCVMVYTEVRVSETRGLAFTKSQLDHFPPSVLVLCMPQPVHSSPHNNQNWKDGGVEYRTLIAHLNQGA